jgi:hypothetical protein
MTAVMASPRPTRYALRSQAFSPCHSSDPGIRDGGYRHREPAPAARGAAAARCRAQPNRRRSTPPLTARLRPRLRPRHSRTRDPAGSPPEHPSPEGPTPSSSPLRNRWSTVASMSGIAASRSPRRADGPARALDTTSGDVMRGRIPERTFRHWRATGKIEPRLPRRQAGVLAGRCSRPA